MIGGTSTICFMNYCVHIVLCFNSLKKMLSYLFVRFLYSEGFFYLILSSKSLSCLASSSFKFINKSLSKLGETDSKRALPSFVITIFTTRLSSAHGNLSIYFFAHNLSIKRVALGDRSIILSLII